MSVVYALEEATASTGPWITVAGSPFSTTTDVVSGLSASTAYYFRITAQDTLLGINALPTVVGPIVTSASSVVESAQNTRISSASASTVPPVGSISSTGSGSSLSVSWSIPAALYDSSLNAWSLYTSGTSSGVQVARNGTVLQNTNNVQQIVYWNHTVWMLAGTSTPGWFYYSGDALGGNWLPASGDPALTASPQQTDVTDTVATIIDSHGASWQISSSGQVLRSGVADTGTTGTVELLYWASTVYRKTNASAWLSWNGTAWVSATKDPRTDSALGASPSGGFVNNNIWLIVDATSAVWTLSGVGGGFEIDRNGLSVQSASNVVELLYYQSAVYQAKLIPSPSVTPGGSSFTDIHGNVWLLDSGGNVRENRVLPGSGSFTDPKGNVWSLNSSGNPVVNGNTDTVSHCQFLELIGGTIWQEDLSSAWYNITPTGTITSGSLSWNGPVSGPALSVPPGTGGAGTLAYTPTTDTIYAQSAASGSWYFWNGTSWVGPGSAPSATAALAWSFWNNGSWNSVSGDPRVFGASNPNNASFFDDFTSLNMYNIHAPASGQTWQPAWYYSPQNDGATVNNDTWLLNPFYPPTPINNIYTVSNSILNLRMDNTPSQFSSGCGGMPYVGGQLQTALTFSQTYGYFEVRVAVQPLAGTEFGFILYCPNQGFGNQIDVIEVVTPQSPGAQYGGFALWDSSGTQDLQQFYTYNATGVGTVDCSQFHRYGVLITPTTTTFYIDRVAQNSWPTPSGYNVPLYPVINIFAGDPAGFFGSVQNPGQLPITAQVDYVGIWTAFPG